MLATAFGRLGVPRLPSETQAAPHTATRLTSRSVLQPAHANQRMNISAAAAITDAATGAVSQKMADLRENGRTAFIPFIVAGDPDLATTADALRVLDEEGAAVIELGVPYSDPLADGSTIQAAASRALTNNHIKLGQVMDMLHGVETEAPIVLFTYYNPIMARGLEQFCADAKAAGVSGLLVPDIPLEETPAIREAANAAGIEIVLLVTPTTPSERMQRIAEATQGFVYLVSVTGVTGERAEVSERVPELVTMLREVTGKAVSVGFGVSDGEQARKIKDWGADGVIVGSALVKALGQADSPEAGLKALRALAKSIVSAIK